MCDDVCQRCFPPAVTRRPACIVPPPRHDSRGRGRPRRGDLIGDSVGELAAKLSGHDAVVFSAGAHGTGQELTTQIDGRGLEKAGVTRFVLVSAFPEAGRGDALGDGFEHSPWTG